MGPRTVLPDATYLAITRSVNRSISPPLIDIGISDWLIRNHLVSQIAEFPPGLIPGLIAQRITHHVRRRVLLTIPSAQQIDFETPVESLGLRGLKLTVITIYLIIRRNSKPPLASPNHYENGRSTESEPEDAIEIAILRHRSISVRTEGRTFAGSNSLFRIGPTPGKRFDNIQMPPIDEMVVWANERLFLSGDEIIPDLHRYGHPMASLSNFVSRAQVAFSGLGCYKACSFREATRVISDVSPFQHGRANLSRGWQFLMGPFLGFHPKHSGRNGGGLRARK